MDSKKQHIVPNELTKLCRMRMYETLCFRMVDDNANRWTILDYDFTSRARMYK